MTDKKRDLTNKEIENLIIGIAKPTFEQFMHLVQTKTRKLDLEAQTNINMISLLISALGSIETNVLAFIRTGLLQEGAGNEEVVFIMQGILDKIRGNIIETPCNKDIH